MAEIYTLKHTGTEIDEAIGVIKSGDNIDTTLSTAGKAADAAVVGQEVTNLAKRIASIPVRICNVTKDIIITNDSASYPIQSLAIYGKTEDDLSCVGDVTIRAQGKNLLNPAEAVRTHATAVVTLDGDKLHVTTDGTSTYSGAKFAGFRLLAGVTYILSAHVEAVSGSPRICFRYGQGTPSIIASKSGTGDLVLKYTPDENVDVRVDLLCCEGTAMAGEVVFSDVQLEVSNEATAYEVYKDGGSVTISTGGLHGILVANGGNVVNDAGAQYIADCIDLVNGQKVQRIGVIDSYAGEDVGDVWQSSTGELTTGAMVVYALSEPVATALETSYASLAMQTPLTIITTDSEADIAVSYVTTGIASGDGWYVAPVSAAWEQRMLDRIDQCMIPTAALRDVPKASTGYIRKGQVLTGINYSAVHQEARGKRMVGVQVPLSTYYSAMENPASKMYTEDKYQDDNAASSYYGIVCSGFVSYVIGSPSFIWTQKMATMVNDGTWTMLDVENEHDLFKVKRGDILLNTVISSGNGDHVRIVRDVVYDAKTGRLIGFNLSESWKPFCRTTFYNLTEFLAQMHEDQPYRVVRLDDVRLEDGTYSLDVEPIKYSKNVYPDKGDGGKYTVDEEIWLYLPNRSNAKSITYMLGDSDTVVNLDDLEFAYVNGVIVYRLPISEVGTYTIATDVAPDDPCTVTIS